MHVKIFSVSNLLSMWENGSGSMASGMDPSEGVRVGGEEATSLAFESMRRIESPHPSSPASLSKVIFPSLLSPSDANRSHRKVRREQHPS